MPILPQENDAELQAYFEECEENRALLEDIIVAVPARPSEGICINLALRLSVWYGEGTTWRPLEDSMMGFIEITRARIARDFLNKMTQKWLLMIDSDMEPPLRLPYLLARHDQPVVGACCMSYNRDGNPMLCFTREDTNGDWRFVEDVNSPVPATGLAEVPHVGTGAMLIRRDVLESFTWEGDDVPFILSQDIRLRGAKNGVLMKGEDIVFCNQVREKGYKIHVDMEAHCGHRKEMRLLWPDTARDPSMTTDDWKLKPVGMMLGK